MADTKKYLDFSGLSYFASKIQTALNGRAKTDLSNIDNSAFVSKAQEAGAGGLPVVTTEGDGTAYTATVPGITSLTAGATFIMVPHTASTVTNPKLNVNSLGDKYIKQSVSSATATGVIPANTNWLSANKPVMVMYDGTCWKTVGTRSNAADLYGTLAVGKGGTGKATFTAGSFLVGNGTDALAEKTPDEVKALIGGGSETQTATLTTSGWALSGDRYTQTVSVSSVAADTPVVLVDCALTGTDLDADATVLEAWQLVSCNNVAQGAGSLTFYAYEAPTVNIPVNVGVA